MNGISGPLRRSLEIFEVRDVTDSLGSRSTHLPTLVERINIPYNSSSASPGLIQAETVDPWSKSGKYALGWVYFCILLLVFTIATRLFHIFTDKIRTAMQKDGLIHLSPMIGFTPDTPHIDAPSIRPSPLLNYSPDSPYLATPMGSETSMAGFVPRHTTYTMPSSPRIQSRVSSIAPLNNLIAMFRWCFYRPTPIFYIHKKIRPITLPSLAILAIASAALVFTALYTFVPQPLYWRSIRDGSPPVAIRSGMIAVAMMPWLVALSMKANLVSFLTGIGHERLNVLHRWGGWLCLFLSLVHTVPFYIMPIWDRGGYRIYHTYFGTGIYIYGTGIAALVPLIFLCLHSLPFFRHWAYEMFVIVHVPASIVFLAMMFWHCNNYLTSWNYLFATVAIWLLSYLVRIFYLNWTNPRRVSWLKGDEAGIYLMPENAIKVTIPTQVKWKPGQFVYLRIPGISAFENHPFTIASLCSDDFPSEYGPRHRDMVLVFRPFGGFTRKVLDVAVAKGPWHSHRAFIDGPYGGMQRSLEAFDHVILFAGGSGITALISHLLDLIKRMRDGKAVTKQVHIIWAFKRPETMEWFKEELRICREFAPPDTVQCQFYITAAKRLPATGQVVSAQTPSRPMDGFFKDKVNNAFQDIATKRQSHISDISAGRHSQLIRDEAGGDVEKEAELRRENEDNISALPLAHVVPVGASSDMAYPYPHRNPQANQRGGKLSLDIEAATHTVNQPAVHIQNPEQFNFGFISTPTEFQKNLMRFAFLPGAVRKRDGWSIEYGRPDIPFMLKQASKDFGRRTCVFVCGPPGMRRDVAKTVASLQKDILHDSNKDELFLHTENYSI